MENTNKLLARFHVQDGKFRSACKQLRLLNHRIEDKQTRYDRAYSRNMRSARYTFRLQLATMEGLRNMFYEYASRLADELEEIQYELISVGLVEEGSESEEEIWE